MKVIVVANVEQQGEILLKKTNKEVQLNFITSVSDLEDKNYDAIFDLTENIDIAEYTDAPVFINSVISTLKKNNLPANYTRINAWPGFLKRTKWEVATGNEDIAGKIFKHLNWDVVFVKDEPGLISARVVSMLINEAFFALGDNVSNAEEIDLAMKLGTNYPYGPFEWQEKIGLQNIYRLLQELSLTDKRYSIAPLLEKKYLELSSSV